MVLGFKKPEEQVELTEAKAAALFTVGDLRARFGSSSANAPLVNSLEDSALLSLVTEDGKRLDTKPDVDAHKIGDAPFTVQRATDHTTLNYAVKALEEGPGGVRQPGPNEATEIARIAPVVNTAATQELNERKRREEEQFQWLLQTIREDGEYLQDLLSRLKEIDEKLKVLAEEEQELTQAEMLLNDVSDTNPAKRQDAKARLQASLKKLGMDLENYTDANGAIDRERLERDLRERRERLLREQTLLLEEREDIAKKYAAAERNRDNARTVAQATVISAFDLPQATAEIVRNDTTGQALKAALFADQTTNFPAPEKITAMRPQANPDLMEDAEEQLNGALNESIKVIESLPTKSIPLTSELTANASLSRLGSVASVIFEDGEKQTHIAGLFNRFSSGESSNEPAFDKTPTQDQSFTTKPIALRAA